jgi:uncharacterized protein DUF4238
MLEGEKHHYIPVFYLKQWAGADGRLCQYSRPYNRVKPKRVHLLHMLKRKRRSIAFPASALITQAGAEALRRRIKPCRLGLAFALLTRKLVAA